MVAYTKAQALHAADALSRRQIMYSLVTQVIFITVISVLTSVLLSIFVSKSVSAPLKNIEKVIQEIENDNQDDAG